jgi:hypothetical protein
MGVPEVGAVALPTNPSIPTMSRDGVKKPWVEVWKKKETHAAKSGSQQNQTQTQRPSATPSRPHQHLISPRADREASMSYSGFRISEVH